jgi:hypothetical protein
MGGNDRRAWPELGRDLCDCPDDFFMQRGRRAQDRLSDLRHVNLIIG